MSTEMRHGLGGSGGGRDGGDGGDGGDGPRSRTRSWLLTGMIIAVILSGLGFAYTFDREAAGDDGGAFTLLVLVYLTMALGFASLLGWAAIRGMFHDVERPKYRMLEREEDYERHGI